MSNNISAEEHLPVKKEKKKTKQSLDTPTAGM
jgi:hypothetical protein